MSDVLVQSEQVIQSLADNLLDTDALVKSQEATEWLQVFGTDTGRRAYLGNPADWLGDSEVYNAVVQSNSAVEEAIMLSKRLARDTSRTKDARNEAAEVAVNRRDAVLADTHALLMKEVKSSLDEIDEVVHSTFSVKSSSDLNNLLLHQHIRELAGKEDGPARIRALVGEDIDVAKLIYDAKPYLIGLNKDVLENLKLHAAIVHVPGTSKLNNRAERLLKLANAYPKIRAQMKRNLYTQALADRSRRTRVDDL